MLLLAVQHSYSYLFLMKVIIYVYNGQMVTAITIGCTF